MRALIVDDDEVTRAFLAGILEQTAVACDEAVNGADAIRRIKQTAYGLIFLDILMPRIDGWGVLDFIRAHRTPSRIYVMTGGRDQHLSAVDQEIVAGVLTKPFDREKILALVEAALAASGNLR